MPEPNITSSWKSRFELFATVLLVLVTLMIGGFALADRLRTVPSLEPPRGVGVKPVLTSISIPVADAPVQGSRNAKVALVLFSDFECPVCARAAQEVLPQLKARYIDTGKVLLVWQHYPLPIHSSARGAAEAAECASRQGKFWEIHDWAFAHQQGLQSDRLREAAEGLGLDMRVFGRCTGGEAADRIARNMALAEQLDVSGTPTWFVGTVDAEGIVKPVDRITGLGPVDVYANAIDRITKAH